MRGCPAEGNACGLMIMQVSSCKINAVVVEEEKVGGGGGGGFSVSASGGILPHDSQSSERGETLSIYQLIGFSLMSTIIEYNKTPNKGNKPTFN